MNNAHDGLEQHFDGHCLVFAHVVSESSCSPLPNNEASANTSTPSISSLALLEKHEFI